MSNTVIIIKSSGVSTNTPNVETLSYGELSLNYADGIIYYKTDLDALGQIKTTEPAGLDTEIQFNDGGSFAGNANLTFDKTTGTLSTDKLNVANLVFSDGSYSTSLLQLPGSDTEIEFNNNGYANTSPFLRFDYANNTFVTSNVDATNIVISGTANLNSLIIPNTFDIKLSNETIVANLTSTGNLTTTGDIRAANLISQSYIEFGDGTKQYTANAGAGGGGDVTSVAGATGAVSNTQLLDGIKTVDGSGSGLDADTLDGLDSLSFANSSYMQTSYDHANGSYNHANSSFDHANGAFDQANSANVLAQAAYDDSNTRFSASGGTISGDVYVSGNILVSTTSVINANTVKITNIGTPTDSTDAATKQYVDTIAAGSLHYHAPVRVESPIALNATYDNGTSGVGATLTNAGTQAALVIDGITLNVNDRVLVYQQSTAAHNGVYTVTDVGSVSTNWILTRAIDADSYAPSDPDSFGQGDAFFVQEGATGAGELYVMNTEGSITFGTTDITFAQISSAQIYSAGSGLTLNGVQFSVSTELNNLINYSADHANGAFDLANGTAGVANTDYTTISVTPGTYGNATSVAQITVSANGRIESISNVTISGGGGGGGTPAGANLEIQFNDNGSFGASGNLIFDTTSKTLIVDKIESNVSIGVGTSASGVVGEIRAANNITAFYTSDIRNKTNIHSIENALEKVINIGGKTFDWNDEYIKQHGGEDDYFVRKNDFGVIAQDVLKYFPIAVREKSDGSLAVDYVKLCSLAFQAIIELNEKIKKLEEK